MSLQMRMVAAPHYVDIRSGALDDLSQVLLDQRISSGGHVAIITSKGGAEPLSKTLKKSAPNATFFTTPGNSLNAANSLAAEIEKHKFDAVVGVGGGRVIDVTKYAASKLNLPMVSVATNLAHDGIASPVSILEIDKGRASFGVSSPVAVIIDLGIVKKAPERYIRAGIGDVLSNLSAVKDWELAQSLGKEKVDGLAASLARTSAEALIGRTDTIDSDEFLIVLAEALVLSGIAMGMAGSSRPCSGACHEISHAIDELFPERTQPHGEQVAVGALFATFLREVDERFAEFAFALAQHNLPVKPSDLGFSTAEFAQAVTKAPQTRPDRFTILEHLNLNEKQILLKVKEFEAAIDSLQLSD
jgi:glycerol-1-phosphate dehydrogenase [NAD(P)+]